MRASAVLTSSGGVRTPPGAPFSPMDYGAKANGTTSDANAFLLAAQAAVAAGGHVRVPAGTYLTAAFNLTSNAVVVCDPGVEIRQSGTLGILGTSTWLGGTFRCQGAAVGVCMGVSATSTVSKAALRGVTFAAGVSPPAGYSRAALQVTRATDSLVEQCAFQSGASSGANIEMFSGIRFAIKDNVISGGATGIKFGWGRSMAGTLNAAGIWGWTIAGNTISGQTGEGILFECSSQGADTPSIEAAKVAAISGQTITLEAFSGAYQNVQWLDMVPLDGALAGRWLRLTAQSGAKLETFTVADDISSLKVGDPVVIAAPYRSGTIVGNDITAAPGRAAILLNGLCLDNRIVGNRCVDGGIDVRSVDNLPIATGRVSPGWGRAPSAFNVIDGNILGGAGVSSLPLDLSQVAGSASYGAPDAWPATLRTQGMDVSANTAAAIQVKDTAVYAAGNLTAAGEPTLIDSLGGNTFPSIPFSPAPALASTLSMSASLTSKAPPPAPPARFRVTVARNRWRACVLPQQSTAKLRT